MSYNNYIPIATQAKVNDLLKHQAVVVKVVKKRKTKHGDFRKLPSGKTQITVNESDNPYRFLITLLHEIALSFILVTLALDTPVSVDTHSSIQSPPRATLKDRAVIP